MPFPPTPSITPSNTPTSSVTPSNTPTNTPSGTQCPGLSPTPTNTLTPTITPSSTNLPTIYLSMCLPPTIPANGIVYNCFIARTSADCSGSTINVPEYVQFYGDIYIFLDGEWVAFGDGYGYINSGQSCNCDAYNDFGLDLTGYSLSATTTLLIPSASTLANYVVTGPCFEPSCLTCITPTPTPTITQTPSVTPTATPTPTPPCLSTNYRLFNETASPLSWEGIDCSGNGVGGTILGGQQADTGCIQNGTLIEGSLTIVSSTPC